MRTNDARGECVDPPPADQEAIRSEFPRFLERARQLLELAEIASGGPDPEALIPDVVDLGRLCAEFAHSHL